MGPAAGNGAGEGDGVVVEVVGGDGTLGSEDEGGGFGGGKAFEEVGNSFVVVDFFETAEGGGEVVGFGGFGLAVIEVDKFGGTEVELLEELEGFGGFEEGLNGFI